LDAGDRRRLGSQWLFTQFWFTGQKSNAISEATFVVEQEVGAHADLFIEYVGDYPNHARPAKIINSGAADRYTATQQIDFHAGFGLTSRSPSYFFGLGYSVRFDSLF
jgi:predicted aminopeptidase